MDRYEEVRVVKVVGVFVGEVVHIVVVFFWDELLSCLLEQGNPRFAQLKSGVVRQGNPRTVLA